MVCPANVSPIRFALIVWVATCACVSVFSQANRTSDPDSPKRGLFLLAANIEQPGDPSDPVVVYRATAERRLVPDVTVLEAEHGQPFRNSLTGVFSIHDVGDYLIVDYPHIYPRNTIFIPKERPSHFETIKFDPENFINIESDHNFMEGPGGLVCGLWPLFSVPSVPDGKGGMTDSKQTLRSVCKKPGSQPFLKTDNWDDCKSFRMDGDMRYREVGLLTDKNGKLADLFLGGPTITMGAMPVGFDSPSFSSGVLLKAASARYLVVSISNPKTGQNGDTDVFARTTSDSKWMRLPVLPVAMTANDKMYYRLFDDWLVTSASAALLTANHITESIVPDALTVIPTGKQWADWGIRAEPRTTPDVISLPARRITLWNLAASRRIDLAIPEDDSEIVHVFDGHSVLVRIKDMLFSAEIQGSKLADYKLVAHDSAIPQVHWAFYSSAK